MLCDCSGNEKPLLSVLPHTGLFITTNRTSSPLTIPIVQLDNLKRSPISKLDKKRSRYGVSIHCSLLVSQQGVDFFPPLILCTSQKASEVL